MFFFSTFLIMPTQTRDLIGSSMRDLPIDYPKINMYKRHAEEACEKRNVGVEIYKSSYMEIKNTLA